MAFDTDPYRTLGLDRGATLAEVKRAYRRLAKINHPDAAGEAALPRFLAIQAAYDQIAGPAGRARPGAGGAGAGGAPGAPRRPWSADPDRAGATYRAYGGRAGRSRTAGGRPGSRPGSAGSAEGQERAEGAGTDPGAAGAEDVAGGAGRGTGPRTASSGSRRRPGTAGAGSGAGTAGAAPRRPARPPNKATLGSTSYDGAEGEPFEPDWGGASWYGTTSGTYWTLNPKEYADPRKHGPEYQMRGRRRRPAEDRADEPAAPAAASPAAGRASTDAAPGDGSATGRPAGEAPVHDAPPDTPTHTATSWWEATSARPGSQGRRHGSDAADTTGRAGAEAREAAAAAAAAREAAAAAAGRARSGAPTRGTVDAPTPLAADPFLATIRGWLDDPRPSPVARVGRAVLGWVPLALAIGWVAGELSGCARFSADCDPRVAPATWLVQVATLGALIALAPAARIAATAAVATVLAVVPGAILLLATSDPAAIAAGRVALGVLMAVAWLVGLSVGMVREVRRIGGRGPGQTPRETPP